MPESSTYDTYDSYDLETYQSSRLSHLTSTVNMPDYESAVSESKHSLLENTWKNSHPATGPPSVGLSRANSDVSLYAPVRRRSVIRTPGVATRAETAQEVSRRTSLRSRQEPAASARQSRRNSIEPTPPRILSVPVKLADLSVERAVTPSETEYKQLGAMKFGSLRITNGAPSPSSEKRRRKRGSGSHVFVLTNDSDSSLESNQKLKKNPEAKIVEPQPILSNLSPITATFLKLESRVETQQTNITKAETETFAGFLPGMNFGSFSLMDSRPASPELQTTSKHTAVEDDLFEDDAQQPAPSETKKETQPKRRGNRPHADVTSKTLQILSRQDRDSGIVSSPTSDYSQKPFSKTDSGYSSNVSIRSLRISNGSAADKDLPPCPGETQSPRPALTETLSPPASFLGDFRLPSPRLISLANEIPAPPDREAPPPPPPPKDFPASRANSTAGTRAPEVPVRHIADLVAARPRRTRRVPVSLLTSKSRASGPRSPDSIQLSPPLSDSSNAAALADRARKPGPLKRLLSVTSRRSSRDSGGLRRSFRNSGSSTASSSRDSASTPDLRARASREARPSNLANVESTQPEENDQIPATRTETPEEITVRRRRSLQAISNSVVNAAVAVFPSRKSLRRSISPNTGNDDEQRVQDQESQQDQEQRPAAPYNERWSGSSSAESDTTSTSDYTRDALSRNGYDPSFVAMTSARDAYFSPAPSRAPSRAGSVASRSERELDIRLAALKARSNAGSPASFDTGSPHQSYVGDHPYINGPSHGLTRTRSVIQLRVPPPLRPQSNSANLHRARSQSSLTRQLSSENLYSFPPTTASSQDGTMTPPETRMQQQQYLQRTMSDSGKRSSSSSNDWESHPWQPRILNKPHSRAESTSSQGSSGAPYPRSASANPYSEQQRQIPRRPSSANPYSDMQQHISQQLRHRSSYESQNNSKPRSSHGYFRQSPDLWTSTHYQQLQMQYGGTAFDPRGGWYPPYVPRSGHARNRSSSSNGYPGYYPPHAPFRVLHSYNSPAYRHAPIWG